MKPGEGSPGERSAVAPEGRSSPSQDGDELYRRMVAISGEQFAYLDRSLVYRAANAAYLQSWGVSGGSVIGRGALERADPAAFGGEDEEGLRACLAGQRVVYEAPLPRRGAQTGWGEVCYSPWLDESSEVDGVVIRVHDITARKTNEATIERLTRIYRTLSECSQAIIRCDDSTALFPVVCHQLVTHGGLAMAWIGRLDKASGRIDCAAFAGEGGADVAGVLDRLAATTGLPSDDAICRATREDALSWSADFQSDPATRSWHELGRRFGWQVCASLPLNARGQVVGVLSVYGQGLEAMDEDGRKLLMELARDTSNALDHFLAIEELAGAEERWKFALEGTEAGVWDWDMQTDEVFYSRRWKSMLGIADEDTRGDLRDWQDRIHPEDLGRAAADMKRYLSGEVESYHSEYRLRRSDGSDLWILDRGKVVGRRPDGAPTRMIGTHTDITARHEARDALSRLGEIVETSQTEVYVVDPESLRLEQVNQGARDNLGYSMAELSGMTLLNLEPDFDARGFGRLVEPLRTGAETQVVVETRHRRKDGSLYPAESRLQLLGRPPRLVALVTDVTERKLAEEAIRQLAFFDPLTGLPNRRLLMDRLERAIAASRRMDRLGALMFIDLDDFKTLNDTLGHDHGDRLLSQVARRLASCIRETDTLARLGGDEFIVILERLSRQIDQAATQAETLGNKLLDALRQPCRLEGRDYQCLASMGITLFGPRSKEAEELLQQADLAMYRAKQAGRNRLRFFDPAMQAEVTARAALAATLHEGLQQREFVLHYQMQVDAQGRVRGAEGLLRWQHPQRGLLEPAAFIPLAEETAAILPLGRRVLAMGCAQLVEWGKRPETAGLTLAVNISARQFHQPDFVDQVLAEIDRAGCDPTRLKLELTENLLRENLEAAIAKMRTLEARGVTFALDDFGTGYSSLSDLRRMPLKELKIDRSFVRDLASNDNDAAIARTIIALGGTLELDVIAEGVETEAQRDWLAGQGCQAFQGYLFGRPGPAETSGLAVRA